MGEFSERELSLLRLLAEGENNRDIAAKLHLSEQTVKNLLSEHLSQAGRERPAEAVAVAMRTGMIRQGE